MTKPIPPITGTSSSRKPLYIGLIVAALVVVLVLVYFGGKQFAGKATALTPAPGTTLTVGQAGITGTTTGVGTITIDIGANIGSASSVAFDFRLNYPADALEYVDVTPVVTWGQNARSVFERKTPGSGQVSYELATLDHTEAVTGSVALARVTFNVRRALTSADYQALQFSSFHVYNLENEANLISTTIGGSGGTEIQQCTASTQDECLSNYNNLILRTNCPTGTTVDGTSCTTYFNANLAEKDTLCAYDSQCVSHGFTRGGTGYNADLNLDTRYDGQDAQVVFGTRDAKNDNTCGGTTTTQNPCNYDRLYICDDGSFRVTGLTIYNGGTAYAHASQTCPYTMAVS